MGQARVDPVDHARLIVLGHLTSECCKASLSAKSEVITMSEDVETQEPNFRLGALMQSRSQPFESGCALADEGSVFATILVMIICVVLSVSIIIRFI